MQYDMKPLSKDNATGMDFVDISTEKYRQYTFPGYSVINIDAPTHLHVSPSGHRVLDAYGISHYVPKGWIHLSWVAKEGQPRFVK